MTAAWEARRLKREFLHANLVVARNNVLIPPRPHVSTRMVLKRPRLDKQERSAVLLRSGGKLLQPPHEVIVCHGLGPRQPVQLENVPGVIIGQDTNLS